MSAQISACSRIMKSLKNTKSRLLTEEFPLSDCIRLVERCEIFDDIIGAMEKTPQLLDDNDQEETALLVDLEALLMGVLDYIHEFTKRENFFGTTDPSFRYTCAADFLKLNEKLITISQRLNLVGEIDYDARRSEDLQDRRDAFKAAFHRAIEECCITNSGKIDSNYQKLKTDLDSYPSTIGKFLSLNKYLALTLSETKELKIDADWMKDILEEKFQPSIQRSQSMKTDSPSDSSDGTTASQVRRRLSMPPSMDTDFVTKLVEDDLLNNDQLSMRLKLLAELKLEREDVLVSSVKIGQGGFGEVFLGNYKRRFKVAIKTIRNLEDPQADIKRRSIENELLLMKYLGVYPTIISCYGYVMNGNSMQIVLELAPYGSLDKILRDSAITSIPIALTFAWLCDLSDAIKFLHSKNIKHRDIKAENMLVFDHLQIKLCDFGPAKEHISNITAESRVGTFCFMAPEIRVGKVSELASDVFSFAMTAIQIISRKNPRIDNFKGQIAEALTCMDLPDPAIVKQLTQLFTNCVAYDPAIAASKLRPSSSEVCHELTLILEDILGGDPRDEQHPEYPVIAQLEHNIKECRFEKLQQNRSAKPIFRPQSGHKRPHHAHYFQQRPNETTATNELLPNYSGALSRSNDEVSLASFGMQSIYSATPSIYSAANMSLKSMSMDVEEIASIANFLQLQVQCSPRESQQIAISLVRTGVLSVDILRRRLNRNPEFLLDLGMEETVSERIMNYFLNYQLTYESVDPTMVRSSSSVVSQQTYTSRQSTARPLSRPASMAMMNRPPSALSFMDNNGDNNSLLSTTKLPSEIARLFYDASQCNNRTALFALQELASGGSYLAECFLMRMIAFGQGGLDKDINQAKEMGQRLLPWLQEVISMIGHGHDLGKMYLHYLLGVCYSEGLGTIADAREGIRWYKLSADEGYAAAQAYLGACYYSGLGVPQNFDEAAKYYQLAADQGYAGAQCNLGLCYEHGWGVTTNAMMAVRWYRASAEQGDAAGNYNLGYCYERGYGLDANEEEAFDCYLRAASLQYTPAIYNVGVCYYFGTGVEQDIDLAVEHFMKAAKKGYATAQSKLGLCYENGHGVEQDMKQAVHWYKQAALQGDAAGLYYLGFCYFSGTGIEKNYQLAVHYYQLAAQKNYAPAHNNLGYAYFNGVGVTKNFNMAVKHYKAAADQGYAPALYNMGYCHERGIGCEKKLNLVLRYYLLAAKAGNVKAREALKKYDVASF